MSTREMTVAEFAERIRRSESAARLIIARGEIDVINIGSRKRPSLRITEAAYAKYIKSREIKGSAA